MNQVFPCWVAQTHLGVVSELGTLQTIVCFAFPLILFVHKWKLMEKKNTKNAGVDQMVLTSGMTIRETTPNESC